MLFTVTLRRLRFSGEAAGTQGDEVRAGEQVWLDRTRPAILHPGHVLFFQKAQDGPGRPWGLRRLLRCSGLSGGGSEQGVGAGEARAQLGKVARGLTDPSTGCRICEYEGV